MQLLPRSTTRRSAVQIQADAAVRFKRYDVLDNFLRYGLKYGALIFCAWCAKEVLVAFAGNYTFADVTVRFFSDIRVSTAISWGATTGFGIWGYVERKRRQKTIKRLAPRIAELETRLDPQRSSSHLNPTGTTRKEDRL